MNATEAIDKIVKLLKLDFKKEEFKATFLEDGTEVTNNMSEESEFEIGQTLYVVKESTLAPAPKGSHTTREGLVLTVDDESTIIAIASKETETTEVKEDVESGESKMETEETDMVSEIAEIIEVMTPNDVSTEDSAKIAEKIYDEIEKMIEGSEDDFSELEEKITEEIAEIIEVMTPDEVSTEDSAKIAEKIVNELNGDLEESFKKGKKQMFSKDINDIKESISQLIELDNSMNGKFKTEVSSLKNDFESFKKSPERKSVEEKKTYVESFSDYKVELIKKMRR
jgi:hypothetical protein